MKKVIYGFLIFTLCWMLLSCQSEQDGVSPLPDISHNNLEEELESFPDISPKDTEEEQVSIQNYQDGIAPLPDISPTNIEEQQAAIPGETNSLKKWGDGFLLQYHKDRGESLCFFDETLSLVWEHEIRRTSESVYLFGDDAIFILIAKDGGLGFARLDKSGSVLWETAKIDVLTDLIAAFPDQSGGAYLFGTDYNNQQFTRYHIDRNGQIVTQEPFEIMGNVSALQGWFSDDGGYWLLGISGGIYGNTDKRFLSRMDMDFNVINTFELLESQYPIIVFLPEDNRILLYGQAYKNDSSRAEYGFIYEFDYNMNQKKYLEFDDCVPNSVIRLKDGRWIVSCYDRENIAKDIVKIFDKDWKEVSDISIEYAVVQLFALDDGGFAIAGSRLSPGQPYGTLFLSSVRPTLDLVYECYDAECKLTSRKTYSAQDSNSGYGYCAYVDKNGKIYLF